MTYRARTPHRYIEPQPRASSTNHGAPVLHRDTDRPGSSSLTRGAVFELLASMPPAQRIRFLDRLDADPVAALRQARDRLNLSGPLRQLLDRAITAASRAA